MKNYEILKLNRGSVGVQVSSTHYKQCVFIESRSPQFYPEAILILCAKFPCLTCYLLLLVWISNSTQRRIYPVEQINMFLVGGSGTMLDDFISRPRFSLIKLYSKNNLITCTVIQKTSTQHHLILSKQIVVFTP